MAGTTRTFVALTLPSDITARLADLESSLARDVPGAKWVERENMHITLAFLGDVANADLDRVGRAVAEVGAGYPPFSIRVEGMGAFPDARRPRTVWAGVGGEGLPILLDLRKDLSSALGRAGYPSEEDRFRFHPHVTLARFKPGRGRPPDLTVLIDQHRGWSAGGFEVAEVVTFASTPGPKGPSYNPLAKAPLQGGKTECSP